jgi:hypothetical protein
MTFSAKGSLLFPTSACLLLGLGGTALPQTAATGNGTTALPNIVVEAPRQTAGTPKQKPRPRTAARPAVSPSTAAPTPESPGAQLAAKGNVFD